MDKVQLLIVVIVVRRSWSSESRLSINDKLIIYILIIYKLINEINSLWGDPTFNVKRVWEF